MVSTRDVRVLSSFPAAGFAAGMAGAILAFLSALAENVGLPHTIGEPVGKVGLFVMGAGIVIYLIGVVAAATIDPAGFFRVRFKTSGIGQPRWKRLAWASALI